MSDFVIDNGVLTKYTGPGGDVVIPEGVTAIGERAFAWCERLTSVVIPEGVTTIGFWAFWGCSALASVVLPEGVTAIGDLAFDSCEKLILPKLPVSLKSVGSGAFNGCIFPPEQSELIWNSILLQVSPAVQGHYVIPDGVTVIDKWAFWHCTALTSVVIPESVTAIGEWAFEHCEALTSVFNDSSCPVLSRIYGAGIIDGYFPGENLEELTPVQKMSLAVSCLRYPEKYSDEEKKQYLAYLRRQSGKILERLAGGQDVAAAVAVMQTGFIKPAGYQKAVAAAQGNPEMVAAILEYQHANVDLAKEAEREERAMMRDLMRTEPTAQEL